MIGTLGSSIRATTASRAGLPRPSSLTLARGRGVEDWGITVGRCGIAQQGVTSNGDEGLMLVDGYSVLYHSYHATVNLEFTNRKNEPTGAIYTFIQQLRRLQREVQPSYFAVMLDEDSSASGRRKDFSQYKEERKGRCPKDLALQLGKARQACDALSIPWRAQPGYEADDLIATYTWEASKDCDVKIVSSDKDLLQLIGPRVRLCQLAHVLGDPIDRAKVKQDWGVEPEQIGDLLALSGDSSDSIPGIPGIGFKKGAALLRKYETLESVLDAARAGVVDVPGIGPKLLQNLRDFAGRAIEMRSIVELRHVPGMDASMFRTDFRVADRNQDWLEKAASFCDEEDMKGLMKQLTEEHERVKRQGDKAKQGEVFFQKPVADIGPTSCYKATLLDQTSPYPEETEGVVEVTDAEGAARAMEVLRANTDKEFAISVEVSDDKATPGVLCFSVYGGRDLDFGGGRRLWVDLSGTSVSLHECSGSERERQVEPMGTFREFFESENFRKVYHCFSGIRSAFVESHPGLKHGGFAGDTMHMARLLNPALPIYSLEEIALRFLGEQWRRPLIEAIPEENAGKKKRTSVAQLQKNIRTRQKWIEFSTLGSVMTFQLRAHLCSRLRERDWKMAGPQETPCTMQRKSMLDFYERYWRPLGEVLSDMEQAGIGVCSKRLGELIEEAARERLSLENRFRQWARERIQKERGCEVAQEANLEALNLNSSFQLAQLFFGEKGGPAKSYLGVAPADADTAADPSNHVSDDSYPETLLANYLARTVPELKRRCKARMLPQAGKKADVIDNLLRADLQRFISYKEHDTDALDNLCKDREIAGSDRRSKSRFVERLVDSAKERLQRSKVQKVKAPQVIVHGLGIEPLKLYRTNKKAPQVSIAALEVLKERRRNVLGADGVEAVATLIDYKEVEAVLSGFLWPLRNFVRSERVHAQLNLNTETGRLSSRRPNMQGEPLGGRFPIRDAFAASEGNSFIIVDYMQLELRMVAHLADCPTMIEVLSAGGDIHSKTAYQMFEEVRDAVAAGEAILDESATASSNSGVPLVKDRFPELRRRAKTLNFSLLYGKTAWGFSKDWRIPESQAQTFIDKWFAAYPEVKRWKSRVENTAEAEGARTLLGRTRPIPNLRSERQSFQAQAKRVAANTPVQGSAADVVTLAMLGLRDSKVLQRLNYRQVLQIHDEIILEGPEEHAQEALQEVVNIMEDPLPFKLRVQLRVDARVAKTWHAAKSV